MNKPNETTTRIGKRIELLPIEQLQENDWNPNEMTEPTFAELVAELEYLGEVPKPIIVRPIANGYEVIDGAHSLRGARELDWTKVCCQIVEDVDDLEAMRQTWKRNQHGSHNPLLEGELFEKMREKSGLSKRAFAREMNIPESTIRIALNYPKALKFRADYTEDLDQARLEIEKLTAREAREYCRLPPILRDRWLDSGAELWQAENLSSDLANAIELWKLGQYVDGSENGFPASIAYIREVAEWGLEYQRIDEIAEYLQAVAQRKLPIDCLEHLPIEFEDDERCRALLSVAEWETVLNRAVQLAEDRFDIVECVSVGVGHVLQQAGVVRADSADQINRIWDEILANDKYQFLAIADFLTIEERVEMYSLRLRVPAKTRLRAMQYTCEVFSQRRDSNRVCSDETDRDETVTAFYKRAAILQKVCDACEADSKFLRDRESMVASVIGELGSAKMRQSTKDGRIALAVFEERLHEMPLPELCLLACCVVGWIGAADDAWLDAIGAHIPDDVLTQTSN